MGTNNICNYIPIETLSRKSLDNRFGIIHKYLCYLSAAASGGSSAAPGAIDIGGVPTFRYGSISFMGDGTINTITIPHTLTSNPTFFIVFNDSPITTNFQGRTITADSSNIYVNFLNPPGVGEDATFVWLVAV